MYSAIFISITLMALCEAAPMDQAISAISYHRKDVPLSYNFSQIHIYTTKPPHSDKHIRDSKYLPRRIEQYAPVPINKNKDNNDDSITDNVNNQWVYDTSEKSESFEKITPLEPQEMHNTNEMPQQQTNEWNKAISGHNIALPRETLTNLKPSSEFDYKDVHRNHQHREVFGSAPKHPALRNFIASPKQAPTQINDGILANEASIQSALKTINRQLALNSMPRYSRLDLNIARAYNVANLPQQAQSVIKYNPHIHYKTTYY